MQAAAHAATAPHGSGRRRRRKASACRVADKKLPCRRQEKWTCQSLACVCGEVGEGKRDSLMTADGIWP
jgi:hypothetical protein